MLLRIVAPLMTLGCASLASGKRPAADFVREVGGAGHDAIIPRRCEDGFTDYCGESGGSLGIFPANIHELGAVFGCGLGEACVFYNGSVDLSDTLCFNDPDEGVLYASSSTVLAADRDDESTSNNSAWQLPGGDDVYSTSRQIGQLAFDDYTSSNDGGVRNQNPFRNDFMQ